MSKYTTELRFIIDTEYGEGASDVSVDHKISAVLPKIFDFDFPIFDESYRAEIEKKILKHYYIREIAAETVGLWKLMLNERLNLIMPYFNKLYKSELLNIDPLKNTDIKTERTASSSGSRDAWGEGKTKYSETPQGSVYELDMDRYLTNANTSTDRNAEEHQDENSGTDHTYGFSGDQSDALKKYRETFINIDEMLIKSLSDLFIYLW